MDTALMTEEQAREYLRAYVQKRATQEAAALDLGVSAMYISDVLRSRRGIGRKLASGLGLEREVMYRQRAQKGE